jgi:RNA polymerase sigma-B factor
MESFDRSKTCHSPTDDELPAGSWPSGELGELGDEDLLRIIRSQPAASALRSSACEVLVARYRGLVRACANRYRASPEPTEDLVQVGYVGLMKAINNFDPDIGHSLGAYAQPCITGEIKRYFRDKRWHAHIERPVQELLLQVRAASHLLAQRLGHPPGDGDLAEHLGVGEDAIRDARQAHLLMLPCSLDAPVAGQPEGTSLADVLGQEDPAVEHTLMMQTLRAHWHELPRREQRILLMRFYSEMTQSQIGERLGISQMHVSRLLARAIGHLHERILGTAPEHHVRRRRAPEGGRRAASGAASAF